MTMNSTVHVRTIERLTQHGRGIGSPYRGMTRLMRRHRWAALTSKRRSRQGMSDQNQNRNPHSGRSSELDPHQVEDLEGRAKEAMGRSSGNPSLEDEGLREQQHARSQSMEREPGDTPDDTP